MSAPQRREAIDAVSRLETALVALERSFAALGEAPDAPAALSSDEHRRLTNNLEAMLEEVRQLADFLANDREASDE